MHIAKMQPILIILSQYIAMLLLLMRYIRAVAQTILHLLEFAIPGKRLPIFEFYLADKRALFNCVSILFQFHFKQIVSQGAIEIHAQFRQYVVKSMILFLHLLVVAPALLGLTRSDEIRHAFEDLVRPAQLLENEVSAVEFQEPVIEFVLFVGPMPLLDILGLAFSGVVLETRIFFLRFLLNLFARQTDVALLAEERLEIVAGYHFLVIFDETVDLLWTALLALYFDFARAAVLMFFSGAIFTVRRLGLVLFVRVCLFGWISVTHRVDCSIKEIQILNFKQPLLKNIHSTVNSYLLGSFQGRRSS